jgi:hypothetical protein
MAPDDRPKSADALFDEFLDPAIQKILDEADLMEAVRTIPGTVSAFAHRTTVHDLLCAACSPMRKRRALRMGRWAMGSSQTPMTAPPQRAR